MAGETRMCRLEREGLGKCGCSCPINHTLKFSRVYSSSLNSLISKHVSCGCLKQAISLYNKSQVDGSLKLSERTVVALLKACSRLKDVSTAKKIHAKVEGLLQQNIFIGSSLVDAYAKCGALAEAQEVFELLSSRDVVTWTALIGGYVQHGQGIEALRCFKLMQLEGVPSNALTFACGLKACGSAAALNMGEAIHLEITYKGLSGENLFIGSALINMYAKCGSLEKARAVFDHLPIYDVVCWNAMILGYAHHEQGDDALACYDQMLLSGFSPDAFTFSSSLKACCSIGFLHRGIEIHVEIARRGLLKSTNSFVLSNSLMDMYGKCGDLPKVNEMFHQICNPTVVSWTAMIAIYVEHDQSEQALTFLEQMEMSDISPNAATFSCGLRACGSMVLLEKGKELHVKIIKLKLLKNDIVLSNALIDMYCKCGMPAKAESIFQACSSHSGVLWTTLITGYAQLGDTSNAVQVFNEMIHEGFEPRLVTFVSILNACSHEGLVDEAHHYLKAMLRVYGLVPSLEHHTCMVDLLNRAGQLDIALDLAFRTPFHPSCAMWLSLLGGCRKWGVAEIGRQAFSMVVGLGGIDSWPIYACMYNIFTDVGVLPDADKV